MKLSSDIKSRIDNFFENITPEELYELSIHKYGFKSIDDWDLDNQSFTVIEKMSYPVVLFDNPTLDTNQEDDTTPLAA
ncbi:hypothetical protein [Prolixibacter sp. SD074]|jgi:hypothetical protein|uniref:hypothetical protein n=1 Tax=Prolixibacter sp. SD074 TaxID=2652391 RepID=UPI00127FD9C6|nr:hypothetical protein [Prolixibacter sp. SD074]GET30018.1 hypothetical protein SD074_22200 [Prolixibacter sp. SD074]